MWHCDKEKPCATFCASEKYKNECGIRRRDMSLTANLKVWRKDRNITKANTRVYVENVIEELMEIYYTDKQFIEEEKDLIMAMFFDAEPIGVEDTIDAIQDIQVFSINETELMGYDNEMCNYEVFKEINSREQDPGQKIKWEKFGTDGKWLKNKYQSETTKYTADYERCKGE